MLARQNVDENYIVIERERGNGSAIDPLQVVPGPAFSVFLKRIKRVIANQVAINDLQSVARYLVRHLFKYLRMRRHALRLKRVGQYAARNVGIAPTHDYQITQ